MTAAPKTPVPSDLPSPVVFGPSFPDFTMTTKNGRQSFQSRTNLNLFLGASDFTAKGTYTMARLLRATSTPEECYRLLFEHVDFWEDEPIDWIMGEEPEWDRSDAFTRLLGFNGSAAERHFFQQWCYVQFSRGLLAAYNEYADTLQDTSLRMTGFNEQTWGFIDVVFHFPALIPQTWLNYVGPEKTAEDEQHLAENPSRVDFVMFAEGRKCVIEVDGPSHYADYDEGARRYSVNEEKYAKNLAIERSLRRQGWEIHRFANVEVTRAYDEEFVRLITSARLPGLACNTMPWRGPYPSVSSEDVKWAVELPF